MRGLWVVDIIIGSTLDIIGTWSDELCSYRNWT